MKHNRMSGNDNFKVKLIFEMLSVRGQQHLVSTHERMFLWKCQSFRDRKCLSLRGTRTPNLRIHAECSNHLRSRGQIFAVHVLNTGSGGIDILKLKSTFETLAYVYI